MMEDLIELFRSNFYWIDFFIGGMTPLVIYYLYKSGRVERYVWTLFWVGFAIGLTWEVPMQVLNELVEGHAVHTYVRPAPAHFSIIIFMHSCWDGGLFLLGVLLARLVCGGPVLERFKWCELGVMVLWGQASSLWVELTAIFGEAWSYLPRTWNPSLFMWSGKHITLMIQLIWLVAPIVFYLIALRLRRQE